MVVAAPLLEAEQIGHLAERHEQAGPRHEAEDDRLRDVTRQVAELEKGDDHLERADEQAEQEDRLQHPRIAGCERQSGDGA